MVHSLASCCITILLEISENWIRLKEIGKRKKKFNLLEFFFCFICKSQLITVIFHVQNVFPRTYRMQAPNCVDWVWKGDYWWGILGIMFIKTIKSYLWVTGPIPICKWKWIYGITACFELFNYQLRTEKCNIHLVIWLLTIFERHCFFELSSENA